MTESEVIIPESTYGLQCKMTYAEFTEMKRTNPDWKGPRPDDKVVESNEEG